MMTSSIKKICSFSKTKMCKKIYIFFITVSDLNKTSNRAVTTLLIKCMKTKVSYCKSDMHMRPMRFSILCTPTDSSDKTQIM